MLREINSLSWKVAVPVQTLFECIQGWEIIYEKEQGIICKTKKWQNLQPLYQA